MAEEKRLTIHQATWTPAVSAFIASALTKGVTLDDMKARTDDGAKLFALKDETGATVGAFLLQVDQFAEHDEGVIVAAGGNVPGVDLMRVMVPAIESMFVGCKTVRTHTEKPAVARKYARLGYRVAELVLVKDL